MALSDTKVKAAKPKEKQYRLTDEKGLYCLVKPLGSKLWRYDYRFEGKRKTMALGVYPDVKLKRARDKHQAARSLLADGIDPSEKKKAEKIAKAGKDSFEAIAKEWHGKQKKKLSESYSSIVLTRLEQDVFPYLGAKKMDEITPPKLLAVLRRVESRGAIETAHRIKQSVGRVFRYAIATGRAERDPTPDLRGALAPTVPQPFAAITDPRRVGELMRAIDGYSGTHIVRSALQLTPLVFIRPGELRQATWSEIDLKNRRWRKTVETMKSRREHIVPLSDQAIAILKDLKPATDRGPESYVFPSVRSFDRPMSENTVNAALRRLGYSKEEMTAHGFRKTASTILHEQGWESDYIERQLAHMEGNKVRAAYNHAQHLKERVRMMQAWADYLDGLKADEENKVVSLSRRANEQ